MALAGSKQEFESDDISELLGRSPIFTDESELARAVAGRTILITGAGGTIGSEIARRLPPLGVARLILVDHSEHALFWIDHELSADTCADTAINPVLGSICNVGVLDRVFATYRPDVVFHAAAYKHVAMVESNPLAGIRTNVLGTHRLLDACLASGVDRFLLVSSDKAANPTSLMGMTKRCAELITAAAAVGGNKYASVRFGNVLGSSGSVVPIFERRIARDEYLEIRDPDAARYFMSKEEAGRLLLLVSTMMMGGEVFVLQTGDTVRILDLARRLVLRAGKSIRMPEDAGDGIEIRFTKLRRGEKLCEELFDSATVSVTEHPCIARIDDLLQEYEPLENCIARLEDACSRSRTREAVDILNEIAANGEQIDAACYPTTG